jgi:hypothetical protein
VIYVPFQSLGVKLCDLYERIRAKVQNEKPELVEKLTNNFGYGILTNSNPPLDRSFI